MKLEVLLFLVLGLVVVVALARSGWYRDPARQARDKLRILRAQRIAKVDGGAPVKVIGTAQPAGEPLVAPLSGRECIAWEVKVESPGLRNRVTTVIEDKDFCEFVLEDESGRALVKPRTSRIFVGAHERYMLTADPPRELSAFLEKHGESETALGFTRSLVFHEGVIAVGEEVAVLGMGRWEADPEPNADADYRKRQRRLVMEDEADLPLTLSDDFRAFR